MATTRKSVIDKSLNIHQRNKISKSLNIKELQWTSKQKEFIDLATNKNTKIMLVSGPAGTSKTLLTIYCSLLLLNEKKISDIIYVRSPVESSRAKLGYLPGGVEEKMASYSQPLWDKLDELLSNQDVEYLKKDNRVSINAPNYIRGLSWNVKCVLFDEAQNSSQEEIITFLTRLGPYCKCFVLADPEQPDLPKDKQGAFDSIVNVFNDEEARDMGIHVFKFDENDILRSDLVKFIISRKKLLVKK